MKKSTKFLYKKKQIDINKKFNVVINEQDEPEEQRSKKKANRKRIELMIPKINELEKNDERLVSKIFKKPKQKAPKKKIIEEEPNPLLKLEADEERTRIAKKIYVEDSYQQPPNYVKPEISPFPTVHDSEIINYDLDSFDYVFMESTNKKLSKKRKKRRKRKRNEQNSDSESEIDLETQEEGLITPGIMETLIDIFEKDTEYSQILVTVDEIKQKHRSELIGISDDVIVHIYKYWRKKRLSRKKCTNYEEFNYPVGKPLLPHFHLIPHYGYANEFVPFRTVPVVKGVRKRWRNDKVASKRFGILINHLKQIENIISVIEKKEDAKMKLLEIQKKIFLEKIRLKRTKLLKNDQEKNGKDLIFGEKIVQMNDHLLLRRKNHGTEYAKKRKIIGNSMNNFLYPQSTNSKQSKSKSSRSKSKAKGKMEKVKEKPNNIFSLSKVLGIEIKEKNSQRMIKEEENSNDVKNNDSSSLRTRSHRHTISYNKPSSSVKQEEKKDEIPIFTFLCDVEQENRIDGDEHLVNSEVFLGRNGRMYFE